MRNDLAKHLWKLDLARPYEPEVPDYEHRVRFQVITEYDDHMGKFANFRWWGAHHLSENSEDFPNWAISVSQALLEEPCVPVHFLYRTRELTSIDLIQDIHEFCVSQGFTAVFVRDPTVSSGFWPAIAVDREEDALLLANFCTNIRV